MSVASRMNDHRRARAAMPTVFGQRSRRTGHHGTARADAQIGPFAQRRIEFDSCDGFSMELQYSRHGVDCVVLAFLGNTFAV